MLAKNDLIEIIENGVTRVVHSDDFTKNEETHLFHTEIGVPREVQVTRLREGTTKKLEFDGLQRHVTGTNMEDARDYMFLNSAQIRSITDKAAFQLEMGRDTMPSLHTRQSPMAPCFTWSDDGWGEWESNRTQTDGMLGMVKIHRIGGVLHSDLNTPTVVFPGGSKLYFRFNKLHRTDGPAVEVGKTGDRGLSFSFMHNEYGAPNLYNVYTDRYYSNSKLHRIGGPAVVGTDGTYEYRVLGVLHRDSEEPTAIINDAVRIQMYAKYGKLHKVDGPSFICPEVQVEKHFFCGMLHNKNGPAINKSIGNKAVFSLFGANLSKKDWKAALKDPSIEMLENNTLSSFEILGARYREEVENG